MKQKILLIGAGGHCKVVLDVIFSNNEFTVAGIVDLKKRVNSEILGVPVIGTDSDLPRFFKAGIRNCFIAVGSIGNPQPRAKLYATAQKAGFAFPNIISPAASVSSRAILGSGNYIAPGAIINAGASIGSNCIINTGAIVDHDCTVGDFVHLSPGSILSGGVTVGYYSHIGTGSVVIQDVEIGEKSIVGAGSVVVKDIRSGVVAYGSPCKERKKNV